MEKKYSIIKIVLILTTALCCNSFADYLNDPNWQDYNDFTHQSWDFNAPPDTGLEGPNLPLVPDGNSGWTNIFGTPLLLEFYNTSFLSGWFYDTSTLPIDSNRTGLYGGMGDSSLTFKVPNNKRIFLWQKHLWIQMTFYARKDGLNNYNVEIARDANFTDTNNIYYVSGHIEELNEPQGNSGKWYRVTEIFQFEDQPSQEYIRLTVYYDPNITNAATMIDQVDIDTKCINIDMAMDGIIDFKDLAFLANQWLRYSIIADLHPDGIVDQNDLQLFLMYWLLKNEIS